MKKCAQDMYFKSKVKGNNEEANVADTFLKMYKIAWMVEISSKALATLEKIRYNKTQLLPLVEDVVTLSNYLKLISEKIKKSGICNQKQYVEFSKMCLAEIILFNRRRSGEEERMILEDYTKAIERGSIYPVIMSTLSLFEQKLCQSHLRVALSIRVLMFNSPWEDTTSTPGN
ncbi:Hypothetical predicted protein [Mytilus galloprovincialis]|uniref:Uncharacterized protein n=1 Tax=Mytilus galloprovincialis TaxID=29158 RepID=A0A8B6DKL8_MYTGA|nr:Hypothetical predicted protein [Mytilus galloprovincialis]